MQRHHLTFEVDATPKELWELFWASQRQNLDYEGVKIQITYDRSTLIEESVRTLRHTLIDERTQWLQRIQATLFHHGVAGTPERLRTSDGRAFLEALRLPADACERIEIALAMIDAIDARIAPVERELRRLARRQTGCRALMRLYGMGELTSLMTLCELGDVTRLSASREAVRAVVEAGLLEHAVHCAGDIGAALEARKQPQVLGDRQLRVERRLLRDPADPARRVRGRGTDHDAGEQTHNGDCFHRPRLWRASLRLSRLPCRFALR